MPLLEAVPNVSEGRSPPVIAEMAAVLAEAPGVHLLHQTSDPDHHRSVFTLAGEAGALREALLGLYDVALRRIDLGLHDGVHPRVGAVDVVPFVPLAGASMEDAVQAARWLAAAVAERHRLPVYLYGEAARLPEHRQLPTLRRGGLAGLAARLAGGDPAWRPDEGPAALHPTAGATLVGARFFLVAFNALLDTDDVALARQIAAAVRESGGGLPAVQAMGVPLASRGCAQVSMNLVDYRRTPPRAALEAVRREAARRRTRVTSTELIGLVPAAALAGTSGEELLIEGFDAGRVLEERLRQVGLAAAVPACPDC